VQNLDIGIDAAGKLRFANNPRSQETIEVKGKVVAPGFIDVLADNAIQQRLPFKSLKNTKCPTVSALHCKCTAAVPTAPLTMSGSSVCRI